LSLIMALGPLLLYTLSALSPLLVVRLGLSATDLGVLWFVTFSVASLFAISGGHLTDRFGARAVLAGVCCAAALSLLVAGMAVSYVGLVVACALSGLAQSVANPATNLLVAKSVPVGQQGLVLGIKQSGVQVGQFLVGLAIPGAVLLFGWRGALLSCSLIAAVGLLLTVLIIPPVQRQSSTSAAQARSRLDAKVRWMTAYGFLTGGLLQATNVYLPLYAHETLDASLQKTGLIVAALGGLGVVARLAWGRLMDHVVGARGPLLWLAMISCVAMSSFTLTSAAGEWLLWVGIVMFSFGVTASNVVVMTAVVRDVRPEGIGRASGWVSLGLYAGFMVGPLLFGVIVDVSGGFTSAWIAATAMTMGIVVMMGVWVRQGRRR
jgi:MFS family permease